MATKTNKNQFTAWLSIKLDIGVPIGASSMEEALKVAKELTAANLFDFDERGWDHNDSDIKVTGIHEA